MSRNNNFTLKIAVFALFAFSFLLIITADAQTIFSDNSKVSVSAISKTSSDLSKSVKLYDCGDLDIEDVTYVLESNVYSSGTCFTVTADNIRILGNGYSIRGQDKLESVGIQTQGSQNFKIKDLKIKNYGTGIDISSGTKNVIIDNVSISDSAKMSINVFDANNIEIKNSKFTGNIGTEIILFTARDKPINADIIGNIFKNNNGNAIRGIGLIADIENNLIIDNGDPTQNPRNRGIWIRSIIERPAPGKVKVPARGNIKNNKLLRVGGSGIVCSAYDGNYCDIDNNFLKDIYGPAAISFGPEGSVARNNLIMDSSYIGIDVIKRQVKDVLVKDNIIVNSRLGISVEPGFYQNQFVEQVTLEGNIVFGSQNGIYLVGLRHDSVEHVIRNNVVGNSTGDAFYLKGNRLSGLLFENNKAFNTANNFFDLNVSTQGINNLTFTNNFFDKYSFAGSGSAETVFTNDGVGRIIFLEDLSGFGINLSEEIEIGFNSVIVDNSNNPDLDIPADVTLYGMPGDFNNPVVFRDGSVCYDCTIQGSLNAQTVTFTIPGAGNYWVDEK